jgi:carbon monoxide dehydrogenase subunit G
MEFDNSFTVQAPLQTVWDFLLNVEEVAPCVPGAEVTEQIDASNYKGQMRMKLGPVQITFQGQLSMEANQEAQEITLTARGQGLKGMGGASGRITSKVVDLGNGSTEVHIHSVVDVSGKVAQFGRGIMQDVAGKQIQQFASCVESKLKAQGVTA